MAVPSSSHREREHGERHHRSERDHHRSSSHHHHRTISSTTLLLVLSLILAVLAVMLSLPSQNAAANAATPAEPQATGVWGLLTPKRSQALVVRESSVAAREAEVARREAELLAGAPGGILPSTGTAAVACPICPTVVAEPAVQTIYKEVFKETDVGVPNWAHVRAEDLLDRELKIADREREMGKREEAVNRREHDASRRESWIMEQLVALGNDEPEEYVYEQPVVKRKAKALPIPQVTVETIYEVPETKTVTEIDTVTVPAPANTRRAETPRPNVVSSHFTTEIPRTTSVEIVTEEEYEEEEELLSTRTVRARKPRPTARGGGQWFGTW